MAKKKPRLSVAHELHHLIGEVREIKEMLSKKSSPSAPSQPAPAFDLKTTMERDGGKCLYQFDGQMYQARILCTDLYYKNSEYRIVVAVRIHEDFEDIRYAFISGKDNYNCGIQKLFTLTKS